MMMMMMMMMTVLSQEYNNGVYDNVYNNNNVVCTKVDAGLRSALLYCQQSAEASSVTVLFP
jgi:hypothetical protein